MADDELTLADYVRDYLMNVQRMVDIAEEVDRHVAAGDLDAAVLVLGVSHGRLAEFNESMADLQRRLQDEGADWQRAVRPSPQS